MSNWVLNTPLQFLLYSRFVTTTKMEHFLRKDKIGNFLQAISYPNECKGCFFVNLKEKEQGKKYTAVKKLQSLLKPTNCN